MSNYLQMKRQNTGLTQVEFAKKVGIAKRGYQRYEADATSNEYREPKVTTAIRIAKALGTTVEKLWGNNPAITH